MSADAADRPAGWIHHASRQVVGPLNYVTTLTDSGAAQIDLHLVYSDDGIYVPLLLRKPAGLGPHPLIVALHGGSGGLGIGYLRSMFTQTGWLLDRLHAEGYAVAVTEGRMEHEEAYGVPSEMPLDHHDVLAVFRYLQALPEVDAARIGFFGVSHGGELQLKIISELGSGPAALVPCEPAVIEFLGLKYEGVRKESNLQFHADLRDDQINLALAEQRIAPIDPQLPILVVGRDEDHLQGLFHKLHELLVRAGKRAEWLSFSHPEHAYQFGPERNLDGTYAPDPAQQATVEQVVAFLNRHVRGGGR
jgi:dienelactone hydrolase